MSQYNVINHTRLLQADYPSYRHINDCDIKIGTKEYILPTQAKVTKFITVSVQNYYIACLHSIKLQSQLRLWLLCGYNIYVNIMGHNVMPTYAEAL